MASALRVAEACRRLGLKAEAAVVRNVKVAPTEALQMQEIQAAVASVREQLQSAAEIRSLPEVRAFADILRSVGVDPRKRVPTVEGLLKRAVKQGALPAINSLVDAYNLASLRTRCSLGAHDLDRLAMPVELRMFTGNESFVPLGGEGAETVAAGLFGYIDQNERVACWCDVRQAEFSKVTHETHNVLLIVEGTSAHADECIRHALEEAIATVCRYCGGTAESWRP